MAFDPVQKILAIGTQTGALRLYPSIKKQSIIPSKFDLKIRVWMLIRVVVVAVLQGLM